MTQPHVQTVRNIIAALLDTGSEDIRADDPLGELDGWDSFVKLNLILEIEASYGIRMSDEDVSGISTLGDVVAVVERLTGETAESGAR